MKNAALRAGPPAADRHGLTRPGGAARTVLVVTAAAAAVALLVAIPTDLIDTPLFSREIPPTWWAWPGLAISSLLSGLLVATYVGPPAGPSSAPATTRRGLLGGILTFFAVGCPVCNKLVLVALGSAGAVSWFAPFQPLLQVVAVALLAGALVRRIRNRNQCPLPDVPDLRDAADREESR